MASYNDIFCRLMQVPQSTPASRVFEENKADYIALLLCEAAHSLITIVMASNNTILVAICHSRWLCRQCSNGGKRYCTLKKKDNMCYTYEILVSKVLANFLSAVLVSNRLI